MYRRFYLLEMPLHLALRISKMTCKELVEVDEKGHYWVSHSRCGAFYFPRWGELVYNFSAISYADAETQEAFLSAVERVSHPFFSKEETQLRFSTAAPRMIGPAAIQAAMDFYLQEVERMYSSFSFDEYVAHLKKRYAQWKGERILNLNMSNECLVRSSGPEYEYVDLVRLMRTDWNEKALVFYRG